MSKIISVALITMAFLLVSGEKIKPVNAGTCASQCGPRPIQFTPGQRIRLEVVNKTFSPIKIQSPSTTGNMQTISLSPRQQLRLEEGFGTEPNMSVLFWHEKGLSLKAVVSKPNFATLRVEIIPSKRSQGDRSVYILDSGRVNVL